MCAMINQRKRTRRAEKQRRGARITNRFSRGALFAEFRDQRPESASIQRNALLAEHSPIINIEIAATLMMLDGDQLHIYGYTHRANSASERAELAVSVPVVAMARRTSMEFASLSKYVDGGASTPKRATTPDASGTPPEFWMPAGGGSRRAAKAVAMSRAASTSLHKDNRVPVKKKMCVHVCA